MLWKNRRMSSNVLDKRSVGGPLGIGGLLLGAVVYFLMGGNPAVFLTRNADQIQRQEVSPNDEEKQFVSVVLADTEDVWNSVFHANGLRYREPTLVLFRNLVSSACGRASSAVGPFYCPADEQVYLDLSFFRQLSGALGAGGDFAAAYVIAHEVGHHIQNLLGINESFQKLGAGMDAQGRNQLSVSMELQADCLAGVWAKETDRMNQSLEEGDIREALNAASAVGDDRLQRKSGGTVMPDSFTHGTSEQRLAAFQRGLEHGDPQVCFQTYSFR